jgi:hypothetical protein
MLVSSGEVDREDGEDGENGEVRCKYTVASNNRVPSNYPVIHFLTRVPHVRTVDTDNSH